MHYRGDWHEGNLASETHWDSNWGQPPPSLGARGSPSSDLLPGAIMQGRGSTDRASKQHPNTVPHSHLVLEAPQVRVVPVKQKRGESTYKSSRSYLRHTLSTPC